MPASNTYDSIESITLTNASSTITFGSIQQTYTDLVLIGSSRSAASNGADIGIQFNSDTSNNYSRTRLQGDGSTASSFRASGENKMFGGLHNVSTDTASTFGVNVWHIMNYSNSITNKSVLIRGNRTNNNVFLSVGLWRSTAAITSITLTTDSGASFDVGSTFSLYGIKAA
jgi:hypothetical protein